MFPNGHNGEYSVGKNLVSPYLVFFYKLLFHNPLFDKLHVWGLQTFNQSILPDKTVFNYKKNAFFSHFLKSSSFGLIFLFDSDNL